jgi:DNA-binding HxlR family transcriptional regulator
MAGRRTYGDRCGVARALDIVGERWALLVVRELLLGPKRFTDLRAGLPAVSSDILAQRLRELEEAGVLRRGTLPPPAGSRIYELTERGRALEPVVLALGRWGSEEPVPPGEPGMSEDALVIALKTMFHPAAADGLDKRYELRINEQPFRVEVADGRLEAARGANDQADATIEADVPTLATVLWHGGAPGDLVTTGDARAVKRFLRLFRPPG